LELGQEEGRIFAFVIQERVSAIEQDSDYALANETAFGSAFLLDYRRLSSQELNEVLAVFNELAYLLLTAGYHAHNLLHLCLSLGHFLQKYGFVVYIDSSSVFCVGAANVA
jgi:hypothetical protein